MGSGYAAAIVNHRTYPELRACLDSLERQSIAPEAIVVVDHDPEPGELAPLRHLYPRVDWECGPNRGFAVGANQALSLAAQAAPAAGFLLLLNADVQIDAQFSRTLIREMHKRTDVALGSGKLLRPDRRTIDSAGIKMGWARRPVDRGSERPDRGQFETLERVFGVSGAAMMIRRAAVPDLELEGELFDEDFFAYHEDTDLAWRAARLGWSCLYVPDATATHRRGWRRDCWRHIAPAVRCHSFKNRYLELIKNESALEFALHLPATLVWEGIRLAYALTRDRSRLPAYPKAWHLARRAWAKRQGIHARQRSTHRDVGPIRRCTSAAKSGSAPRLAAPRQRGQHLSVPSIHPRGGSA